jgi:cell wall assembly regulator SMI1
MQKFTRALTREIEVGGERLAVTLDEKGLSIRPVGSRRPPATLTWAGVLLAATGEATPDKTVTAALQSLRAGGARPTPSSEPATLGQLLARLDAWLAKHRRRYHEGLRPGATAEELASLGQELGRPLPEELRQWLGWHNGQNDDLIGSLVESWTLMSAPEIAAEWKERRKQSDPPWRDEWVPLLDDGQGDLVFLDSAKSGCPVLESWRGRTEPEAAAGSLQEWVAKFVADVEAGRYHEDPERGEFVREGG